MEETARSPMSSDALLDDAIRFHKERKPDLAEKAYRAVLERSASDVADPVAHPNDAAFTANAHGLWVTRLARAVLTKALPCRVCVSGGVVREAASGTASPSPAADLFALASSRLHTATRLAPHVPTYWFHLGDVLVKLKRHADAVTALERAVQLIDARPKPPSPTKLVPMLMKYGHALRHTKTTADLRKAKAVFERAVGLEPCNDSAQHWLAVVSSTLDPASASAAANSIPASVIVTLYDKYAKRFDEHLVGTLKYQTPRLVLAALPPPPSSSTTTAWACVADLGCGTGLFGVELKPHFVELHGVDLSPAMVEEAKRRDLYASLSVSDLTSWLADQAAIGRTFDLVAATDVFVYVGDLEAVFSGTVAVLQPGGVWAFSVEAHPPAAAALADAPPYVLSSTGRFTHDPAYIRRLAAHHGLDVVTLSRRKLRQNGGVPVYGHIAILRRPVGSK